VQRFAVENATNARIQSVFPIPKERKALWRPIVSDCIRRLDAVAVILSKARPGASDDPKRTSGNFL
jgi:hypothetical protein